MSGYDFTACRTLGHAWEPEEAQRNPEGVGHYMKVRCTRCGCERSDIVGSHGELYGRSYRQTPGYRHAHIDRSVWRRQFIAGLMKGRK